MKRIVLLVFSMILPVIVTGQHRVEGIVTDYITAEGLPGAYVSVPGKNNISVTDINSHFVLESDQPIDSIIVSFIGYRPNRVAVNSSFMSIRMEQSPNELQQVIVSASRENQGRINAPVAITLLPARLIEDARATEISQVLNKVSGMLISDFGSENHSVSLRQPLSFIRTQLVMLEDEIPVDPTTISGSGNLKELNLTAVRSIEVLKGPASSLYGSEAIGGAINFITKKPSLLPSGKVAVQGNNAGYKRIDFEGSNTFGRLGIFAGGYYASCSDVFRDYCGFSKAAFMIKGIYSFSERFRLTTKVGYIRHHADLSGSLDSLLFYTNDRYNQYTFCYSDLTNIRGSSRMDMNWNERDNTFITLHFRNNVEDQIPTYYIQRIYGGPPPARFRGEFIKSGYESYGLLVQHSHKFRANARLIAGLSTDATPYDYTSKLIDVTREDELYTGFSLTDVFIQDFSADLLNTAAYMVFEYSPLRKLKLTSALRYDRLDYKYRNRLPSTAISGAPDDRNTFDHLSPKIGLNFNINQNVGFYGNYSVGFAPPMFSQLYKAVIVPVLKPSNYDNYEVGGWMSFNDGKGYADISAYHSDGTNEIVSVILEDGTSQNQSTGETRHIGLEYSLRYNLFEQVEFRLNAANSVHKFIHYVYQRNDYSGNYMNLAPGFILNTEVTYRPVFLKNFRIGAELQRTGKYWIDELNTRQYKGYELLNIKTGYRLRHFNLWVNVMNAANNLYAVRVSKSAYGAGTISYVPGQRRTINFGIEYNIGGRKK